MSLGRSCRMMAVAAFVAATAFLSAGNRGNAALFEIPLDPTGGSDTFVVFSGSLPGDVAHSLDFVLTLNGDFAANPALLIAGGVSLFGSNGAALLATGIVDAAGPVSENVTDVAGILAQETHFLLTLYPSDVPFGLQIAALLSADNGTFAPRLVVDLPDSLQATVTPVPGALPLFVSGLATLGLVAYRRRKQQLVA